MRLYRGLWSAISSFPVPIAFKTNFIHISLKCVYAHKTQRLSLPFGVLVAAEDPPLPSKLSVGAKTPPALASRATFSLQQTNHLSCSN